MAEPSTRKQKPLVHRDAVSSLFGLTVFLAGVALVGWTFYQAWLLFGKAPDLNLGIQKGQAIDFGVVLINLGRLVIRVLLLIVMAAIGSILANRGVKMYASSGVSHVPQRVDAAPDSEPPLKGKE